jgi:hypothetical protein
MSISFTIYLSVISADTFLTWDHLGLHAAWRGHECAWTRQHGWVTG